MDITNFVPQIAAALGIAPSNLLLFIGVVTIVANRIARLIPDDATGWKGTVRKICGFIGLYVQSRVTEGVTVNDVAKAALLTPPITEKAKEVAEAYDPEAITLLGAADPAAATAFKIETGKPDAFKSNVLRSPGVVSVIAFGTALLLLAGCTTIQRPRPAQVDTAIVQIGTALDDANIAIPTTLGSTTLDEVVVNKAFRSFDVALDAVDAAVAVKWIQPGTPLAHKLRDAIRLTASSLRVASAAQRAGNATSYAAAMRDAADALANVRTIFQGN